MNPKVLIIFTCFNRREKTIKCIESLVKGNPNIALSFVIVDDKSNDGTVDALKSMPYDITILNGNGNLFWAGGMRKGIEYCIKKDFKTDYVALINDDVDFFEQAIEKLIDQQQNNKKSIIVGATCDEEGNFTYGAVKINKYKTKSLYYRVLPGYKESCDSFNMNCVLIPKNIFMNLNNLDEAYQHSLADLDYGLNAKKEGYMIYSSKEYIGSCLTNSNVGTWNDTSLSRIKRFKEKESIKGAPFKPWFHFVNKNFGIMLAIRYSIAPYIRILIGK